MSIKVGGTSVISDSRVLENVTGLKTVNSTSVLGSGNIDTSVSSSLATSFTLSKSSGTYTVALGSSFANTHVILVGTGVGGYQALNADSSGNISVTQSGSDDPQSYSCFTFI
jgi:hypothetical protein